MFFWSSLTFSMIQWISAIWSLVPLPFLNPVWTSGISWFIYCWSLAWENFQHYFASVWVQLCRSLSILWHCLSLGLMKTDFFQSCGHCWVFQICWHIECSTLTIVLLGLQLHSTGPGYPYFLEEWVVWKALRTWAHVTAPPLISNSEQKLTAEAEVLEARSMRQERTSSRILSVLSLQPFPA